MRQNQDFGLDACIVVGYDDNNLKEKQPKKTVRMKVLHPEQTELDQLVYRGMFPEEITQLTTRLQTEQFKKLLKTDANYCQSGVCSRIFQSVRTMVKQKRNKHTTFLF
jgi:hypothetical protein